MNPPTRKDINIYKINAMDTAIADKMEKTFNMIVLGAFLQKKPVVSMESVVKGLKKSLPERHHHLIPMNEEAIKVGMDKLVDINVL